MQLEDPATNEALHSLNFGIEFNDEYTGNLNPE